MKLTNLSIKKFRNFESADIDLLNQNVLFGMNDVGKTNLMYAIRYLLDRSVRKDGFKQSDFYKNNVDVEIEIILTIDLTDREEDDDSKHIIAKAGYARSGTIENLDSFYIKITGNYDSSEGVGIPRLYWGSNIDELEEIVQSGMFSPLDNLFKVIYLEPAINLEKTFANNKKKLFDQNKLSEDDIQISNEIKEIGLQLNGKIGDMQVIKSFQELITQEYRNLKEEDISVEMKSELSINGYFGNLIPYIRRDADDNIYPTSGDGRKKILAYSLLNHINKIQEKNQIVIYLIEEPENSLHRSMQIALSKQLFTSKVYKYFFLSTHSSELLYEMDNASLIRIHSKEKINCESHIYQVKDEYKKVKKKLNKSLATALFAEDVLLIEGPSEKALFERVLEVIKPNYELDGGYILEVNGINFEPYVKVLEGLNINRIIKTDNDIRAKKGKTDTYELIGLNRCLRLISGEELDTITIDIGTVSSLTEKEIKDLKSQAILDKKLELYNDESLNINHLKGQAIHLSKIDLENDLYEAIGHRMEDILGKDDPVKYLQNAKLHNMLELTTQLLDEDCLQIFDHENFLPLKELVKIDA